MRLLLNGVEHELPDGSSVADAVAALGAPDRGVAVAVDDDVVPRAGWSSHALRDGVRVEVLTAVQGG